MKIQTHTIVTPVTELTAMPVLIQVSINVVSVLMHSKVEAPFNPKFFKTPKFKADSNGGVAMKAGAIPVASTWTYFVKQDTKREMSCIPCDSINCCLKAVLAA